MATGGPTWDHELSELAWAYWALVNQIALMASAKGMTNTVAQTFLTAAMPEAFGGAGVNAALITCAADIAANSWT